MLRRMVFRLGAAGLFFLAGCHSDAEDAVLRRRIDTLSLKLDSLVDALELQRENDSGSVDETSVLLTPGDSSCSFIKTGTGYLTLRVDSFREYGSGSRVTLGFGNPSSATLKGMSAQLEWEVLGDKGYETRPPVLYKFMGELKPGSMNKVKVLLEDVPPAKLRSVRVSNLAFEEISLSAR